MTKTRILSAFLLAGTCCALPAHAGDIERPYLGLDYSLHTYENSNAAASDAKPTSVRLRAGSVVTKYLGVEAQLALGAGDDDITVTTPGGTVTYKISSPLVYGLFLKPQIGLGPIKVYGLAGYSYAQLKYSPAPAGGSSTEENDDFSYGGGLQVDLGENWGLNADYVHYMDGLNTISGGVSYRF